MNKISCILLLVVTAISCSKKNGGSNDRIAPAIMLSNPISGQSFTSGLPVTITGTINDNEKIAEVHVHISNSDNGSLLVDIHRYPGTGSYTLNETFTIPASGTYRIQIIAKDNSANEGRATADITGN